MALRSRGAVQKNRATPRLGPRRPVDTAFGVWHGSSGQGRSMVSTTYIIDRILQRPNPLLTNVDKMPQSTDPQSTSSNWQRVSVGPQQQQQQEVLVNMDRIPTLSSRIEPFHATAATTKVLETYQQELETFKGSYNGGGHLEEQQSPEFWKEWNRIQEPVFALDRMIALYVQVSDPSKKPLWEKEHKAFVEKRQRLEQTHAPWIHTRITNGPAPQWTDDTGDNVEGSSDLTSKLVLNGPEMEWASHCLRIYLEERFGPQLGHDDDNNKNNPDETSYSQLAQAIQTNTTQFAADCAQNKVTNDTVRTMYNMIGLWDERAKRLGFPDTATRILKDHRRMANPEEVEPLYHSITAHCLEYLKPRDNADEKEKFAVLEQYLKKSGPKTETKKVIEPHEQDRRDQIRLEHYVTLDGAMVFLCRLVKSLFNIEIVRDETVDGWRADVQLFHVFDHESNSTGQGPQHLGSFYVDPFKRGGKIDRPCVMPISSRGIDGTVPVVAMLLQMEPPPWDTEPPFMTWTDIKHLFHETGHVLQNMFPQSRCGTLMGPHYMPRDASEILPLFMEHWLLERTTLYGLIATSDIYMDFSEDSVDALYRTVCRQKALDLSEQVYLASLEWTLLSGFELQGGETIMALQRRLGQELAPHVAPSGKDMTPLIQVLLANATGDVLSFYSYLWADAVAATIISRLKEQYTNNSSSDDDNDDNDGATVSTDAFRRLLLHPGAVVPAAEIRSEWGLGNTVSPRPLLERYGLTRPDNDSEDETEPIS